MRKFTDPALNKLDDSIRLQVLREVLEAIPAEIGGGEKTKDIPDSAVLSGGTVVINEILASLIKNYTALLAEKAANAGELAACDNRIAELEAALQTSSADALELAARTIEAPAPFDLSGKLDTAADYAALVRALKTALAKEGNP